MHKHCHKIKNTLPAVCIVISTGFFVGLANSITVTIISLASSLIKCSFIFEVVGEQAWSIPDGGLIWCTVPACSNVRADTQPDQ